MSAPQRTLIIPVDQLDSAQARTILYAVVGVSNSDQDQILTLSPGEIVVVDTVSMTLTDDGVEVVPVDNSVADDSGDTLQFGTLGLDGVAVLSETNDHVSTVFETTVTLLDIGYKNQAALLGYEFDAVLSFTDAQTVELTKHPIETGANIVDHAIVNPRTYQMQCVVSNTPVGDVAAQTGDALTSQSKRAEIFYSNLVELVKAVTPVAVIHPLLSWAATDNTQNEAIVNARNAGTFVITSISSPKTAETGNSVTIDLSIEEIRIVSSKLSSLPKNKLTTKTAKKDLGNTDAVTPTPAQNQTSDSTLKGLADPRDADGNDIPVGDGPEDGAT